MSTGHSEQDEVERRRRSRRLYGFIALLAFLGLGWFLFGRNVPREVHLRFDLPPIARSNILEIPRARIASITATIADVEGSRTATVNLPLVTGLVGPRTSPAVLNLKPGRYIVRARVRSFEGHEVPLEGSFEAASGEVIVDLK